VQNTSLSTAAPRTASARGITLALAAVAAMALVVAASAWLRLSQGGPCDGWPACRSGTLAPVLAPPAPADALQQAARLTHRASATLVLLAAVALVLLTRRSASAAPPRGPVRGLGARRDNAASLALSLLGLTLGLALLGVATRVPGAASAAPSLRLVLTTGNLLGGLCSLALAWSLWRSLRRAPALPAAACRLARVTLALWALQALAGALSGADASAVAPLVHLLLALAALPTALWLGWSQRHGVRAAEARALLVLVLLQPLLGVLALAGAAAPVLVWLHNASAAAGLAVLAGLVLAASDNDEG
jgi:heme A synthase